MGAPSLPRLSLHFENVSTDVTFIDQNVDIVMRGLQGVGYSKHHHKLIASNAWQILAIDERNASLSVLHETPVEHQVSCIHPVSGDVIFGCEIRDGHGYGYEFYSLNVLTRKVQRLDIPAIEGAPLWGLQPCRIIVLPNEDRIYFGYVFDEDGEYEIGFCRVDSSGNLKFWRNYMEHYDDGFHAICPWAAHDTNALYGDDGYGLYRWSFDNHECTLLAGSRETWGCTDGFGAHARFWNLRRPTSNGTHVWFRTEGPCRFQWRVVRVDLRTAHVETVRWVGVNHDDILSIWYTENVVFVLQCGDELPPAYKLLRAELLPVADSVEKTCPIDLSEPVRPITFKLMGGSTVQASGRTLVARSIYFREMLTSGLQEARLDTVDLTADPDVDKEALSVLLHFVEFGNTWIGSSTDSSLAFRVRTLADRYCMPQLVYLAESILHGMLTEDTVLSFLSRLVGTGGALEDACWAMMISARGYILCKNEDCIAELIDQNPEFAKKLILWESGAEADPVKGRSKRRRVM